MVKKEVEGKFGPIGGRKSSEYTEEYGIIRDAICAAEDILSRRASCSSDNISKIYTGIKVLEDCNPSEIQEIMKTFLKEALKACATKGCETCKFINE